MFAAMLGAVRVVASAAQSGHQALLAAEIAPNLVIAFEAAMVVVVLAATAVMGRIEGRPFWSYGLAGRRPMRDFALGWVGGLLCLSLLVALLHAGGYLAFGGLALRGMPIVGYALAWFLAFGLVALAEEAATRGYLLATLARGIGFWPAAALTSMVFAAGHVSNHGETVAGIAGTLVVGLIFCLLLRVSGSLWLGIGFHGAWDWAQSYLYGTFDSGSMMKGHLLTTYPVGDPRLSGGGAGPEGSLLATPVLIGGAALLVWALRRAGIHQAQARSTYRDHATRP